MPLAKGHSAQNLPVLAFHLVRRSLALTLTFVPKVFHATLLKILHVELTDAEKADLDQYYGFHHIMHWHHIMGTSAANAGGDIGVHAPLLARVSWHRR